MRRGKGSQGKLGDQRAAQSKNLLGDSRIFLVIKDIDARAKPRDRLAFGGNRAAMAGGVNPARHATNHGQSLRSEVASQPLRHARTVGHGMARSHHGDAGLGQHLGVAADAKDERRIVDFLGAADMRRHPAKPGDGGGGGARNFFSRQFRGLSRSQGLGRNGLDACALEFGQRSAEDGFRGAEMFDQFASLRWSQAGDTAALDKNELRADCN